MSNNGIIGIIVIFLIVTGILSFLIVSNSKAHKLEITKIKNQKEAALKDSLKKVNEGWYQRLALVEDLNKNKDSLLIEKEQQVINLTKVNLKLKDQVSSGTGIIISDTINQVPQDTAYFEGINPIRSYKLWVTLFPEPWHRLEEKYYPVPLKVFLTFNQDKLFDSYAEIPPPFNDYYKLSNLELILDEQYYYSEEIRPLQFFPIAGFHIDKNVKLMLGGGVLINEIHFISYQKGINNSYHYITYGYGF